MLIHNLVATGSISYNGVNISYVTGSQTSLDGLNQFSASVNTTTGSLSSSIAILSGSYLTMSGSYSSASGSLSTRVTTIESKYATTGSNIFTGAQTVCANITSTGTIIAQTLNVQQVTSSIVYSSGSNIFGCSLTNTQQFTGSVTMTGSLGVSGNTCVGGTITGTTVYGSTAICGGSVTGTCAVFSGNGLFGGSTNAGNAGTNTLSVGVPGTTAGGLQLWAATNQTHFIQFGDSTVSADNYRGYISYAHGTDTLALGSSSTDRIAINSNGIVSFCCQTCAPGMDIMPSGIGVSTLGGIMRVVTTGTSTGIAVGQSNSNRYTHIAANDIQVFNDDFFLTTRCAFPLSIGTCYTARLTFAATGIACFSCRVCVPAITITGCAATTIFEGYNQNTDDGNGLYIKAGGVNTGKYIMALESAAGCSRMIVLANGNVGIGTTTPSVILETSGTSLPNFNATGVNPKFCITETNDNNSNAGIAIRKKHSTLHPANYWYGDIQFYGWDGTKYIQGALIEAVANGTPAADKMPGSLRFSTNGGSTGTTERMRITCLGEVLVNSIVTGVGFVNASKLGSYQEYTSDSNTTTLSTQRTAGLFAISGGDNSNNQGSYTSLVANVQWGASNNPGSIFRGYQNGTLSVQICYNGNLTNTNGSYGTIASDVRLKENIVPATSKLCDLLRLNVVNFNLIGNKEKHIGFIAQEMQEVFPSFVFKSDTRDYDANGNLISGYEDTLGLKVGMEFAVLVKAIQEQQCKINILESCLGIN